MDYACEKVGPEWINYTDTTGTERIVIHNDEICFWPSGDTFELDINNAFVGSLNIAGLQTEVILFQVEYEVHRVFIYGTDLTSIDGGLYRFYYNIQ